MADKKVAKKAAASAKEAKVVKDGMKELRALDMAGLNNALVEAKSDLDKAYQMLRANELPASHVIKQMKLKIARIHTAITEKKTNEESNNE